MVEGPPLATLQSHINNVWARDQLLQQIQQQTAPAPAPAPAPLSPPPPAESRVAAPLQFHRVEAPGAVVIPVYQDTDHAHHVRTRFSDLAVFAWWRRQLGPPKRRAHGQDGRLRD
ncbi:g4338 [Coccomyxa elongata]